LILGNGPEQKNAEKEVILEMSNHAIKRSQQRGIPRSYSDIIVEFGTPERKP
jgi:hypothetical protein